VILLHSFLTWAVAEVRWSAHSLADSSPERNPVPAEQEAGWAPEPVWTFCRRDKSPTPTKTRTSDRPAASSLVSIPTSLN
jgi:hypothetical protein